MNETLSDTYLKGSIKNLIFLVLFWVGNYFVLTSVYSEKSEWTLEHILASIGMTTLLAICLILFMFFFSLGGLFFGIIGTLICLFGMAWIGDKIAELLKLSTDTIFNIFSVVGGIINIISVVKLVINIRNYRIARYAQIKE